MTASNKSAARADGSGHTLAPALANVGKGPDLRSEIKPVAGVQPIPWARPRHQSSGDLADCLIR